MTKKPMQVSITWRDEGYGRVSKSAAAFRVSYDPEVSDTSVEKLCRHFRREGFKFNYNRASWVNEDAKPGVEAAMMLRLKEAGYDAESTNWSLPAEIAPAEPDEDLSPAPGI